MIRTERIVVIGASAGGVEALIRLVSALPSRLVAPVCVVLHIPADTPSMLAQILSRASRIPVKQAEDREPCLPGVVYVAASDRHLLVTAEGKLRVVHGPRENRARPAVDPLFRSAALSFGNRAVGVVLTGALDDGTAGLVSIKEHGGVTIVQDPAEALYSGMPSSAIAYVDVDHVVRLDNLAATIVKVLEQPPPEERVVVNVASLRKEVATSEMEAGAMADDERPGTPSAYSCPDCGGVLWEIDQEEYVRYRCRVGHAYSPETMLSAQDETLEEALWTAMKTLEESARLAKRLAQAERSRGHDWIVKRFEEREAEARQRAELIRRVLATARDVVDR